MKTNLIGIDIGGTKCAVTYGYEEGTTLRIVDESQFPTTTVEKSITEIIASVDRMITKYRLKRNDIAAIGISCGGPLDLQRGLIMSPPNLPGWDGIPIVDKIYTHFGIKTGLLNDANACALAEWKCGAGRGTHNMVFMTFGTGLGSGLVLDGKLYTGTNGNAGELGHIRLSEYGPVGYGKRGSFEGFCSGGGITQIARMLILEKRQMGINIDWCEPEDMALLTAKKVAEEALKGDELALQILDISAQKLGEGLAIVIDILNPEVIVIGGIYTRCQKMMEMRTLEAIAREALTDAGKICQIMPSELGEKIGVYSALSVGADLLTQNN